MVDTVFRPPGTWCNRLIFFWNKIIYKKDFGFQNLAKFGVSNSKILEISQKIFFWLTWLKYLKFFVKILLT